MATCSHCKESTDLPIPVPLDANGKPLPDDTERLCFRCVREELSKAQRTIADACAEIEEGDAEVAKLKKELKEALEELERTKKQCAAMRSCLEHIKKLCLECRERPDLIVSAIGLSAISALSTDAGRDYISREQVRPLVEALSKIKNLHPTFHATVLSTIDKALSHAEQLGFGKEKE